jgi:hypothetical protein
LPKLVGLIALLPLPALTTAPLISLPKPDLLERIALEAAKAQGEPLQLRVLFAVSRGESRGFGRFCERSRRQAHPDRRQRDCDARRAHADLNVINGRTSITVCHAKRPAPHRKARARSADSDVKAELTRLTVKRLARAARRLWCALH